MPCLKDGNVEWNKGVSVRKTSEDFMHGDQNILKSKFQDIPGHPRTFQYIPELCLKIPRHFQVIEQTYKKNPGHPRRRK